MQKLIDAPIYVHAIIVAVLFLSHALPAFFSQGANKYPREVRARQKEIWEKNEAGRPLSPNELKQLLPPDQWVKVGWGLKWLTIMLWVLSFVVPLTYILIILFTQ